MLANSIFYLLKGDYKCLVFVWFGVYRLYKVYGTGHN